MDATLRACFRDGDIRNREDLARDTGWGHAILYDRLLYLEKAGVITRIPGGGCPRQSCADCYGVSPCPPGWKLTERGNV